MRSSFSVLALVACSVVLLLSSSVQLVSAHVRLLPTGIPIHNAPSPTTAGAYSVDGPCGGAYKFGAQGVTTVQSGAQMSLTIAYNGGHQSLDNAFHVAQYCTSTIDRSVNFVDTPLRNSIKPLSLATVKNLLPLIDGSLSVNASTSLTSGYKLTFRLPRNNGTMAKDCVISLLDQRNWGGCVDLSLQPEASVSGSTGSAAPGTTGAAAASASSSTGAAGGAAAGTNPLVSSADTFTGTYTTLVNQCESPMDAAQNTVSGCCCLKGTATITHTKGQTTAALTASLTVSGGLMCSGGNITVPNLTDPTKPDAYFTFANAIPTTISLSLTLQQTADLTSSDMESAVTIAGDLFQVQLTTTTAGPLAIFTNNVPTSVPRVCSTSALLSRTGTLPASASVHGASASIVALVLAFGAAIRML